MKRSKRFMGIGALCIFALEPGWAADAPADVIERYQLEQAENPVSERAGWKKPRRVLVTGGLAQRIDDLRAVAPGVELIAARSGEAARQAQNVDAILGGCSADLIAAGTAVRWVQVTSAGVENCVSIPGIRERDILVTNMQRIGGPVIAEHVIAMALAFTRGIDLYVTQQAKAEWRRVTPPGRMSVIGGKTMLVVGLGGIGTEVARRAHALGMKVVATRASGRTGPDFVSYVGLPDELHKLAAQADFVVNTAPLTPQTHGMFNSAFFARMQPTAYFINIARGGSVDTDALVKALTDKRIAGAGLDVTDPEPLPDNHPLWRAPNVIITPHVANDSDLGFDAQVAVTRENLRRYVAGERMLSVVDVAKGY